TRPKRPPACWSSPSVIPRSRRSTLRRSPRATPPCVCSSTTASVTSARSPIPRRERCGTGGSREQRGGCPSANERGFHPYLIEVYSESGDPIVRRQGHREILHQRTGRHGSRMGSTSFDRQTQARHAELRRGTVGPAKPSRESARTAERPAGGDAQHPDQRS